MIALVSAFCARHARWTLAAAVLAAVGCAWLVRSLERDVIPELADPQIAVIAEWMGRPASRVASEVTQPLTRGLGELPGVKAVRGASMPDMAYVDVVFTDRARSGDRRADVVACIE